VLGDDQLAHRELTAVVRLAELAPPALTELVEQAHADVVQADRPVEIDDEGAGQRHEPARRSANRTNARVGSPVAPSGQSELPCSAQAELPLSTCTHGTPSPTKSRRNSAAIIALSMSWLPGFLPSPPG